MPSKIKCCMQVNSASTPAIPRGLPTADLPASSSPNLTSAAEVPSLTASYAECRLNYSNYLNDEAQKALAESLFNIKIFFMMVSSVSDLTVPVYRGG